MRRTPLTTVYSNAAVHGGVRKLQFSSVQFLSCEQLISIIVVVMDSGFGDDWLRSVTMMTGYSDCSHHSVAD